MKKLLFLFMAAAALVGAQTSKPPVFVVNAKCIIDGKGNVQARSLADCYLSSAFAATADVYLVPAHSFTVGPVSIDVKTGKVTIREGVTLDAASRRFYEYLEAQSMQKLAACPISKESAK